MAYSGGPQGDRITPERREKETFARVMVEPALVRTAFAEVPAARLWWRVVLALHGKPTGPGVSAEETARVVAAGFRFYGLLYSLLGGVFLAVSLLFWPLVAPTGELYWPLLGLATGAYLLLGGRVARKGAELYRGQRDKALALLLLFLLMVTAFLALFLGAASTVAQDLALVPAWVNVLLLAGAAMLGIGSYVIEAVYLLHAALSWQSTPLSQEEPSPRQRHGPN